MGRPRGTGNRAQKILELRDKGLDAQTIATRLGMKNATTVYKVLREASANTRGIDVEMEVTVQKAE
jgi:orotate phosphoribosyltransferase-like protein